LRRDDFATFVEITKSIVRHEGQTTFESISGFVAVASSAREESKNGTDLNAARPEM
jgi:hypothetical protein